MPVISEQLKPIDTVNGFQIRPGWCQLDESYTRSYLLRASAVSPQSRRTLRRDSISGKLQDRILLFHDRL